MTKLAVAQLGAPTAVVNSSLLGFVEGAGSCEVLGCVGGPSGLLRGDLRPLRLSLGDANAADQDGALILTPATAEGPGAFLGAGRYRFTGPDFDAVVEGLMAAEVDGIALIGGNGTMHLANKLHQSAVRHHDSLCVVGVPKTVDNDLAGTDHAPGYPSAARFLVQAVSALALDQQAMISIEQVRIVETLGRRTGWLALATLLSRDATGAPHLVYVPERPFDETNFLDDVSAGIERFGWVLVVVAEGISAPMSSTQFDNPVFDRPVSGGVALRMSRLVEDRLGVGSRAEVLGLVQRCATWAISAVDREEAHAVGAEAARLLRSGKSGVMMALPERRPGDRASSVPIAVPLGDVAGQTRLVPSQWVPEPNGDSREFVEWLKPLVGGIEAEDA